MDQKEKDVLVKIINAIDSHSLAEMALLFDQNPEQVNRMIPLGKQTWLGYAAQKGKLEAGKYLIEKGVNINQGDEINGVRPICNSASGGFYEMTKLLIDAGAILDTSSSICNPLFGAITSRSPNITQLLLNSGIETTVSYNSNTMKNMDAVAFALMWGDHESARLIALWNAKGNVRLSEAALKKADKIADENAK